MKRLTKRVDGIAVLESWAVDKDPVSVVQRLCSALAAYEDSGLEPEEIKVHEAAKYNAGYYHGDEDRCRWIEKELGPIDHLRDLLKAEQDGRMVVLPCNVGRTVYKLGHYHDCSDNLYETCELFAYDDGACSHCYKDKLVPHIGEAGFELSMLEELGKTVFLTREEAEAALKGGEG